MKNTSLIKFLAGCLAAVWILSGCTAINVMPITARAGDTITVAVGSPEVMTASNTTATFMPTGGGSVPLTIKSIVRLLPEQTSRVVANPNHSAWQVTRSSGHQPWIAIIVIDLPMTGLPVDTGFINVSTTASYPTIADHVNNIPIALEILTGTGSKNPLEYNIGLGLTAIGNLQDLEPTHSVLVHPAFIGTTTWPTYGAIEITLQFQVDGAPPSSFTLISEDVSPHTGSARNVMWKVSGDSLIVSFVSPTGLMEYFEPRFSIVPLPARPITGNPPGTYPSAPPIVTSVKHFDVNGNIVAGPGIVDYTIEML